MASIGLKNSSSNAFMPIKQTLMARAQKSVNQPKRGKNFTTRPENRRTTLGPLEKWTPKSPNNEIKIPANIGSPRYTVPSGAR